MISSRLKSYHFDKVALLVVSTSETRRNLESRREDFSLAPSHSFGTRLEMTKSKGLEMTGR